MKKPVHQLKTTMGNAIMTAPFGTRVEAQQAGVEFVQSLAETYLAGTLEQRYAEAQRYISGQGGVIEICATDSDPSLPPTREFADLRPCERHCHPFPCQRF